MRSWVSKWLGIDRAIAYVLFARSWNILAGLATLFLISTRLTSVEQGFYYTFASVLAMQVFFELGFSSVIAQFASHEMAHLRWANSTIQGNENAKSRLHSLFHLAIKWYGIAALLMLSLVAPAGYYFFESSYPESKVHWQYPWLLLVVCTSGNLFISPHIALLEGTGIVAKIARMRLWQSIISSTAAWLALLMGAGLFASAIIAAAIFLSNVTWLYLTKSSFLEDMLKNKKTTASISWRNEIWPMQWRIALSWLSGYFIFQLFTPITFKYHGPIVAGQVGMSFTIAGVAGSLAMSWISTKTPLFGQLIAKKEYKTLDAHFRKTLWQSSLVLLILAMILLLILFFINWQGMGFAKRLLSPSELAIILCATIANHIIFAQATYVRAHKCEPYLAHAIVLASLVSIACYVLGRFSTIFNMLLAYTAIYSTFGIAYSCHIYQRFKRAREALDHSLRLQ